MPNPFPNLLQIRVGKPKTIHSGSSLDAKNALRQPSSSWCSAIFKDPAEGPIKLGSLGLVGDEVADKRHHGGPDQAVLAYASEHYPLWQGAGLDAEFGAFGENFLLAGLTDRVACIGDVFAVGDAGKVVVQVSHPRQPCATLVRRFQRKDILSMVWETCRGGWYLRVLQEGLVQAGDGLVLQERPNPEWSVARVLEAFYRAKQNPQEALDASNLPGLTDRWASSLREKAEA